MKHNHQYLLRKIFGATIAAATIAAGPVSAANINKAATGTDLTAGASWAGSVAPGVSDLAVWDTGSLGSGLTLNSGTPSWLGLKVNAGASDPINIGSGGTLAVGTAGIDLGGAGIDLILSSSLTLGGGNQAWNVASGRTLTLDTGTFTRSAGATLNLPGTGTIVANLTGLANDSSLPGSGLIPWATVGTGINAKYATLAGGNLVSYTGLSVANFGWATGGSGATTNFEVAATGAALGNPRSANSIRYTGTAGTQNYGSANTTFLTNNAFINAGTGTLTISQAGGTSQGRIQIGTKQELLLIAANAGITIAIPILDSSTGASKVTVVGPNTVTLSGTNTYSGGTYVNSGTLTVTGTSATPLGTGSVVVNSGGTLNPAASTTVTLANTVTGSGSISTTGAGSTLITGDETGFTGTLTHNTANGSVQFNSATSGSANAAYHLALASTASQGVIAAANGDYTVNLGSLSGVANSLIRGGNTATGTTTFSIGNLGTSTTFAGVIASGATKTIAITKVGAGTLTLSGANTYTGATTVSAGRLLSSTAGSSRSAFTVAGGVTNGILLASAGGQWINTSDVTQNAGSELGFDFGSIMPSTTIAPMSVANFTINATTTLRVVGLTANFTVGQTYPLVTWSGSGPVDASGFALVMPARLAGHLTVSGNTLNLVVDSNTGPLSWNTGNGNWNTSTPNWVDATLAAATYIDGSDSVLFDDASGVTGNPIVSVNDILAPLGVTVNSASHNYTISGSGGISGGGSLLLQNGTLNLATTNTYTGSTTVSGGALNLSGGLGSTAITIGAGTTFSETSAARISGAASLVNSGTVTLAGANTYTGGTVVNDGTLQISGIGTLGAASSAVTVAGGILDLGATSQTNGAVIISGGTITNGSLAGTSFVANNTGAVLVSAALNGAGGLTKTGDGTLTLTRNSGFAGNVFGKAGTIILDSGSISNGGNYSSIGQSGADVATLTLKGTAGFTNTADFNIGDIGSSIGTLEIQDSAVLSVDKLFIGSANAAGSTASGTLNLTSGTVIQRNPAAGSFSIGGRSAGNAGNGVGVLNLTNGYIAAAGAIRLGDYGTGIINQYGGLLEVTNGATGINLHRQNTAGTGTYNLNGGVLRTEKITSSQVAINSVFYFNGGILQAGNGNLGVTPFMNNLAHAYVRDGGAVIDSQGYNIIISQVLEHSDIGGDNATDGGLVKLGSGALYLDSANSFTGPTVVSNGLLAGIGSLSGPVVVASTGQLGAGAAATSGSTFIINNNLTFQSGGAFLRINKTGGSPSQDQVAVTGDVTYAGILTVTNVTSDATSLTPGDSFQLFNVTGGKAGNFSSIVGATGATYSFDPTSGVLSVVTVGPSGPATLTNSVSGNTLNLSWPAAQGWRLQAQTNSLSVGLSANWVYVTDDSISSTNITVDPAQPAVFYRLIYP